MFSSHDQNIWMHFFSFQEEKAPDASSQRSISPEMASAQQTKPEEEPEQENLFVSVNLDESESAPPEDDKEIEGTEEVQQIASLMSRANQSIFDAQGEDAVDDKLDDLFIPAQPEQKQSKVQLDLDESDDDLLK